MSDKCYLCGVRSSELLPSVSSRSITTDGRILQRPTAAFQCRRCTLVQKADYGHIESVNQIYESEYDMYSRPNMHSFDAGRYETYASWLGQFFPKSASLILEIGCGRGWLLSLLQKMFPQHTFIGLEPSKTACVMALASGLDVRQGRLGEEVAFDACSFDVIFSVNVIEHTVDPIKLLSDMTKFLKPNGEIVTVCPNGDVLSTEMLYSDHLFSIGRHSLARMYSAADLCVTSWERGPTHGMRDLQLLRGAINRTSCSWFPVSSDINQRRVKYVEQWRSLDAALCDRLMGSETVVCFGAGETSDLLAFLAPTLWSKVKGYVVDKTENDLPCTYRGQPLQTVDELIDDVPILMGVKQHYQSKLYDRLSKRFSKIVRWDDLIIEE